MEPEITRTNPQAYYYWLRQQGVGIQQAGELLQQRFGAPQTAEERAKQAASKQQQAGLAQAGGTIGGLIAATQLPNLFTSSSKALSTPQILSVTRTGDAASAISGGSGTGGGAGGGASTTTGGGALGLSPMAGLGAGAVAAYYGPSYYKYAKELMSGDISEDEAVKSAMLSNPVTAWAVPIADKLGLGIKTGKHKDQRRRDIVRDQLQQMGVADPNWQVQLDTGASFDIGKDGGYRDKKGLRSFELDFENPEKPFQGEVIGYLNPLIEYLAAGDDKLRSDFTGQFTKGILQNADDLETAKIHAQSLYNKMGVSDRATAEQMIADLVANKAVTEDEAAAYRFGVASLFGNPNGTSAQTQQPTRAARGQVERVSPGMYVDDQGKIRKANDLRSALEAAYKQPKRRGR